MTETKPVISCPVRCKVKLPCTVVTVICQKLSRRIILASPEHCPDPRCTGAVQSVAKEKVSYASIGIAQ